MYGGAAEDDPHALHRLVEVSHSQCLFKGGPAHHKHNHILGPDRGGRGGREVNGRKESKGLEKRKLNRRKDSEDVLEKKIEGERGRKE